MLLRCLATRVKMLQHLWLSNSATVATYPLSDDIHYLAG
uniref:Uncharacterized protein n=1 Tax=Anguilla anguilla TaxID=7936 RepID=A0A0E9V1H3_ANGAN